MRLLFEIGYERARRKVKKSGIPTRRSGVIKQPETIGHVNTGGHNPLNKNNNVWALSIFEAFKLSHSGQ